MNRFVPSISLMIAALILPLASDGHAAEAVQKVRFVHASRSNSMAPKLIAQSKGFFRAEGIEAEMIR